MRNFLLLIPILFAMITANAQYTLTDAEGGVITDGSITEVNIPIDAEQFSLHWHLESTNSADIKFEILSTDQPDGAQNLYCVGIHCYPPNHLTSEESLDDNNSAALILYYKPKGLSAIATIVYKISEVGDPSNSVTFTIKYNALALSVVAPEIVKEFLVYPNPANNHVTVNYSITEQSEIVVFNIVGDKVKILDLDILSNNIEIDSSNLPSGTYFYSLISNNISVETKRLVIKH